MPDQHLKLRVVRKLENFAPLTADDRRTLCESISQVRSVGAHMDLVHEGDATESSNVFLSGFACRQKALPDGRRQITGYLLPGDICDIRQFLLRRMDHTISTLSPVRVGVIDRQVARDLVERHPRLSHALSCATLVEESISREWLLNIGQRTAIERLAHLFCEIFIRLRAVGLTEGDCCELPLTQAELADTLALSTVHINRTLQELRRQHVISIRSRSLVIHDLGLLQSIGLFEPDYLHLDRDPGARIGLPEYSARA